LDVDCAECVAGHGKGAGEAPAAVGRDRLLRRTEIVADVAGVLGEADGVGPYCVRGVACPCDRD